MRKIKPIELRGAIDKLTVAKVKSPIFEKGQADAQKDLAERKFIFKTNSGFRLVGLIQNLKEKHGIIIENINSSLNSQISYIELIEYAEGYNSISVIGIEKNFGKIVSEEIMNRFAINYPPKIIEIIITTK